MPWITANMAGVNYVLLLGTFEEVRLAMPNWINEPAGTVPQYDESVRVYEVEVVDPGTAKSFGFPARPNLARDVALIEEQMGKERFCFLTCPENPSGYPTATLEEIEDYKRVTTKDEWLVLRLVKKYSWTFKDAMP